MDAFFPFFLRSSRATTLVIGGGEIARAKIEALHAAGVSHIRLLSASLSQACIAACQQAGAHYEERDYEAVVLDDIQPRLAIIATNDALLNQQIAADARDRNILVNVVDDPDHSDFIMPAIIRRDAVTIAVSTGGLSPVLARHIKQRIEKVLPNTLSSVVQTFKKYSKTIRAQLPDIQARRVFIERLLNQGLDTFEKRLPIALDQITYPTFKTAVPKLQTSNTEFALSMLYLVSAGPGDINLLTLAAIEALSVADVVLYDKLVPYEALERYARRDGLKIDVGKRCGQHTMRQEDINTLIEQYLKEGKIVVRFKGGDAGIYARTTEEIAIARKVGIPYRIIPGVSAALGCAAALGVPLTDREETRAVRFLTVGKADLDHEEHHDFWQALRFGKQETFVFYMSGRYRAALAERLLALGFNPDLPVAVVTQGTCIDQQVEYLSLQELTQPAVLSSGATLIMMGATFKKVLKNKIPLAQAFHLRVLEEKKGKRYVQTSCSPAAA